MKALIIKILKYTLFFSIGIILFWLAYRDQDVDTIVQALREADYFYISLSFIVALLSHLSRAIRWTLLIEPLGYTPRRSNSFLAVLAMYLINLALPRMGEVSRCGIISRYENVPFSKLLGTVFIERLIDLIFLVVLLLLVLALQFAEISNFVNNNIGKSIYEKLTNPLLLYSLLGALFLGGAALWFFRKWFSHTVIYKRLSHFGKQMIEGIKTIRSLKNKWAFIGHTVFIYAMYFLMVYICFFAFDFTSELGWVVALAVFVISSFGMVAPAPGGIGAWHVMAIGTLLVYNISKEDAGAFAIAVHGATTLLLIVSGFVALILLPVINRRSNNKSRVVVVHEA